MSNQADEQIGNAVDILLDLEGDTTEIKELLEDIKKILKRIEKKLN